MIYFIYLKTIKFFQHTLNGKYLLILKVYLLTNSLFYYNQLNY